MLSPAPSTAGRRGIAAIVLLVLAILWAVWSTTPPAARPVDAAATEFSAIRAIETVRAVACAPHPSGSAEAARVRSDLTARLRATGLTVETLRGVGAGFSARGSNPTAQAGRVETLVATLPGRDPTLPAIAVMAHTDSVPDSFGAADDGFGVAVALETARAIAAGPRPARDLVLILTDGEESGLLGAQLFFADRARAARIGAIVNVDSRGTSGLGTMFETGPGSGGLIAVYRAASTQRFAHSAATFLYNRLPNRTDLSALGGRDIPALNFAFLDGQFDYHTLRDRVESVDPRTLQSLGDQILPAVRAVASARALPPRGEDGVFGDVPGLAAIRYPAWVGWPLLAVAIAFAAWGTRGATTGGTARAAAATLWIAVAAALAARAGYALTGVGEDWGEHHRIMAAALRYEAALSGLALATILVAASALARPPRRWTIVLACVSAGMLAAVLGRPPLATAILAGVAVILALPAFAKATATPDVRAGSLALGLIVSLVIQATAPALTPLFLWPTLAAALAAVAARRWPDRPWIEAVPGLPALAYTLVFAHAVILALGVPTPEAIGVFAMVAALLLLPLAGGAPRVAVPVVAAAAAVALLAFRFDAASERYPALSRIHAVRDAAGQGWRVSPLERPDAWTRAALGSDPHRARMPILSGDPVWRVRTAPVAVPPPVIAVTRLGALVTLTVTPASGGRDVRLRLAIDRPARAAAVEGAALPGFLARAGDWRLRWTSPGEPVTLRFAVPPGTGLRVEAAETTERRMPLPPRPATVIPWQGSDRIVSIAAYRGVP